MLSNSSASLAPCSFSIKTLEVAIKYSEETFLSFSSQLFVDDIEFIDVKGQVLK